MYAEMSIRNDYHTFVFSLHTRSFVKQFFFTLLRTPSGSPEIFSIFATGVGYHMVIVKDTVCDVDKISEIVTKYVPEAQLESNISAELSYVLPSSSSQSFEAMFHHLESNRHDLGISSYGASVTTMEEVFLKYVRNQSGE